MNAALLEELLGLLKTINETVGVPQGQSIEDKNVLQGNNPSDPNKRVNPRLNSSERTRTTEIASLFARTFFEYQKKKTPDSAIKTSIQKVTGKTGEKIQKGEDKVDEKSSWSWLKILSPLVVGIGALIAGLMTDGPFKGALKILARLGLGMVERQIKLIIKLARGLMPDKLIGKLFEKLIPKNFIGNLIKRILPIDDIIKMITSGMTGFINSLKGMVGAPFKALGGMAKGGGIMAKMLKFLKPLVGVLKRIPLLGSIISIGFAISRFGSGDIIGGVIDVLSALSGLLYLTGVGAPVAFAIGLGLDLLNAFLDAKTGGATGKQQGAKINLLGDMAKGIGNFIWKNALWLPVIGGFKRMQMAGEAFASGNIMGGLYQFGVGLLSFVGLSPIVTGIEMLLGFGEKEESDKSLSPKTGWFSGLKGWIKNKLKDLPYFLRKPLEWFGILDDSDETTGGGISGNMGDGLKKLKEYANKIWGDVTDYAGKVYRGASIVLGKVTGTLSKGFNYAKDAYNSLTNTVKGVASKAWGKVTGTLSKGFNYAKDAYSGLTNTVKGAASNLWGTVTGTLSKGFNYAKDAYSGLTNSVGNFFKPLTDAIQPAIDTAKKTINNFFGKVTGWLKNLWPFGDSDKENSEELERRAKDYGWNSVEEYKKSNWGRNENTIVSDAIKAVKPSKPEVSDTPNTIVSDAIKAVKPSKPEVSDTPSPSGLPIVQSGNQQSLEFLHNIGMKQIKIMDDIKGIATQILKKMDSSMGGRNSNTVVPISQSPPSQNSSTIPMNSNRSDYGASAYSLA